MSLKKFLEQLKSNPQNIEFDDTIAVITELYDYHPTRFRNGQLINEAGSNEGSCKIFAFGRLQGLSEEQTLHCFGAYYREDVLKHPNGEDHSNIRNFIEHGWQGIEFDQPALTRKKTLADYT